MKKITKNIVVSAALILAFAAPASAQIIVYEAALSGSAAFPANDSLGTGLALVAVDLDQLAMRVAASFSGLTGTVTAAHIHCCVSPLAVLPTDGVATPVPTFPGFPSGVTAGFYDNTFDLTQAASYNPGFINGTPGQTIGEAMTKLLAGLHDGEAYLNIHTTAFPGGEIRGFLQAQTVPLPAAFWFMAPALAGLLGWTRRAAA